MCDVTGHSHWIDNVRCKMHQTRLQVKRTSRLRLNTKFGDDIFITFPLIDRTASKMLSQKNLQVPSRRPFCFNLIAPKSKN